MRNSYNNILIIKPSALGDIVHALPVLEALRVSLPTARISWLVRKEFAPLLECVEGLDEILLFDRKQMGHWYHRPAAFKALWDFMHRLKNNRYDLVLDLQGLLRTGLFARMTGCPTRIGMADCREFAGLFYTRKVRRPKHSMHVLDYYHALLKEAGFDTIPPIETFFNVTEETVTSVKRKLEQASATGKYFVLVPSSAHPSKCWSAKQFAKLAENLHRQFNLSIVITGTHNDKPIIDTIKAHCSIPIVNLMEQTSIVELIALLQNAAGVISNDTGPGHIAATMHIPTVLIFGHTNPMRVGPYGRPECVAAIEPDHRPALIESPNPAHRIEHVPFELVWGKITTQLKTVSKE